MTNRTKEAIMEAAILLFNTKGYSGTTVRDISKKAGTNISNISYYFGNKSGLLEACFTAYFEGYLAVVERGYGNPLDRAVDRLKNMTQEILLYESKNIPLTRLVLREISLDTQMVREIMSTYFVKEKYFLKRIFEEGIHAKEFHPFPVNYMIIQYKSLLTMPFLNPYYLTEVLQIFPNEAHFTKKYFEELCHWIEGVLCVRSSEPLKMIKI